VTLARELSPAIITLDVQLPDTDGHEVLAELKADEATKNIPVLMVSILGDRDKATALGAVDVFTKPVLKDSLLAAIKREVNKTDSEPVAVGATASGHSNGKSGGANRSKRA
jgi:DNA-binding response OmpR family regulator